MQQQLAGQQQQQQLQAEWCTARKQAPKVKEVAEAATPVRVTQW